MPNRVVVALKVLVHLACLTPFLILAWHTYHDLTHPGAVALLGPDPTATLSQGTGFAALRILIISLAITPVRRLSKHLSWLVRFRRMLGLYAFFYACVHLLVYLKFYANLDWPTLLADLTRRRYIIAGFSAWLLLLPLALTSTKWSIRKLGKRWQLLHRLVYVAAVLGIIHYWWIVKTGVLDPLKITIVLAILLLARSLWSLIDAKIDAKRRQNRVVEARQGT
ncbi:MAG TPA: protein-methionine-sulfoxide reductase heme-binding subunit MsrQ [Acidobacteriaceae bacterium]|nr:protein-methionine-sulfoxide reductase heme-binding subunit MsrQ [Acidobacteriaceae bacterium]